MLLAVLLAAAVLPPAPAHGFILDEGGVLTADQVAVLNRHIKAVSDRGAGQMGIFLTNDLRGRTRSELSAEVFRAWGIGYGDRGPTGKGRGLLILAKVSQPDRGVRVEVGHDLEGRLNDGKVGAIIRGSIPDFAAGRWYEGLGRMVGTFAFEMTAEAQAVAAPARPATPPKTGWPWWMWAALFGLVGAATVAGIIAYGRRWRWRKTPATGEPKLPARHAARPPEPAVETYVPPLYMPSPLQPVVIVPVVETHHHHTYESPAPSYSPDPSPSSDSGSSWVGSDSSSSSDSGSFGGGGDSSGGGSDSNF